MGRKSPKLKSEENVETPSNESGEFIFPNNDRYIGEFVKNSDNIIIRQGLGTLTTTKGITYKGSWDNDKMQGNGKLIFPSGAVYEGSFDQNSYQGNGQYTWPDGCCYHGNFEGSKLQGEGQFKDTFEQIWTGSFHYKAAPGLKFKLNL